MASPATPYASASLYVGDLPRDVTEALLFEIFNAVGPVASVRICRDAATRRSLGYAYVNFHRMEDAERALDTMNFKPIRGQPCRIMWSHRDPSLRKSGVGNIFVKNLHKSIDNKSLYDTFSMFGNILSCKVAANDKAESLGYGFVHYETEEAAQSAIQRVDGKVIAGQKVMVSPFKPKKDRGGDRAKFTNLYVKHLPADISEEKFNEMFKKFGTITKSHLATDKDGKFRGFAFINFSKPEEAKAAIEGLHETKIGEEQLYVAPHQKKHERERELRIRWEQKKANRQKQYQGVNLYIKNLMDNIDDGRLLAEFNKFGAIKSAKVMLDEQKKSKGFGFVCFANPEDATKAVTDMNGRMLEGKPLYVALAQPKEVRRAQLEAQYAARAGVGFGPQMYHGPSGAPLFYPQRPLMYPQGMPMVPGRWNPQAQGGPGGMINLAGPQSINYGLVPMPPRQGGGGGPQGRGRGRGRGGGAGGQRQPQQGMGQPYGDQRRGVSEVHYTNNVRNQPLGSQAPLPGRQAGVPGQPRAAPAARAPVVAPKPVSAPVVPAPAPSAAAAQPPLTIKALAAAPPSQKKQMIGERLFPLVLAHQPTLAGKITGMLLEMDNGELINLLEDPVALKEKMEEALAVLHKAEEEDDEEEDEEEEA